MGRALPATLLGLFLALWTAAAIHPLDRMDWWLENILIFLLVPPLVASYRYFRFSNVSYILMFLFTALHVVGSHWSYSMVPWPDWRAMGFGRNEYDRVVHMAYGLLLAYPASEFLHRTGWGSPVRCQVLALQLIVATSALYEILEWATVEIVAPGLGNAFLGAQGDGFDAVEDMAMAGLGAVVAVAVALCLIRMRARTRQATQAPARVS